MLPDNTSKTMVNFTRRINRVFGSFALILIAGCSISKKSYTQDFGYSSTIYRISRSKDTIIAHESLNKAKIWGKIVDDRTKEPFYDFGKISLRNLATDTLYSASPDLDGVYLISVNPGTYKVSFTPKTGDQVYSILQKDSTIIIQPGEQRVIDFTITGDRMEVDGTKVYKNKRASKKTQRN
jgi:hypothetical protein